MAVRRQHVEWVLGAIHKTMVPKDVACESARFGGSAPQTHQPLGGSSLVAMHNCKTRKVQLNSTSTAASGASDENRKDGGGRLVEHVQPRRLGHFFGIASVVASC
jgi:hypothetical protein